MRDIVVGVDGTDTSWRALAMAIGVARRWEGCMIHICYISQVPVSAQLGAMAVPISPLAGGQRRELKQAISEELARSAWWASFTSAVATWPVSSRP